MPSAATSTPAVAMPPTASAVCQAADLALEAKPLLAQVLLAVNDLDDAAALAGASSYVSEATFIGDSAVTLCRSGLPAPNANVCSSFTENGIQLLRTYVAAGQAIREAGDDQYFRPDATPAQAALEEANKYAGAAAASLEAAYC